VPHHLYLVRHGEQLDAEYGMPDGPLSPRGRRQAELLGERMGGIPFDNAWHSPLQRAAETAAIIAAKMPALKPEPSALLFDCIPSGPAPETPKVYDAFFGSVTEAQIEAGSAQMADAAAEFLRSHLEDRHDLLITHNFVIAWLVREALGAPDWRWLSIGQANCGLTVLTQKSGRPWSLLVHNDLAHLPPELRTGMSEPYAL
jgi:broad specificity phosphatase PhoE